MADCVKTSIMKAIQDALEAMVQEDEMTPRFAKVIRNPSKPIDHDFFVSPTCFVFDEPVNTKRRNRVADCTMNIQIEAWVKNPDKNEYGTQEEQVSDLLDTLEADVHIALATDQNLRLYAKDINPLEGGSSEKFFIDEFYAGIAMIYVVKFLYEWNDPYDIGRQW